MNLQSIFQTILNCVNLMINYMNNKEFTIQKVPNINMKIWGRKKDAKKLHKVIMRNKFVWITSIEGIGKSTFAKYYAKKYRHHYINVYWIDWKGSLKLSLTDNLNIAFKQASDPNNQSKALLYFRGNSSSKNLLIIDGIDNYTMEDIRQIKDFNCKIIFTSKITTSPLEIKKYNLPYLSKLDCFNLFKMYYKQNISMNKFETKINRLVNNHTLTIKLLGIYANKYSLNSIDNLCSLKDLKYEINIGDRSTPQIIMEYLNQLYKINFTTNKKYNKILKSIAILPAENLKINYLRILFGDDCVPLLNNLENLGLLEKRDYNSFYLHNVLAEVIRNKTKENEYVLYDEMINNLSLYIQESDDSFKKTNEDIELLNYCYSILKFYKYKNIYRASLLVNTSALYFRIYADSNYAIELCNEAVTIYEENELQLEYARALSIISEFYNKIETYNHVKDNGKNDNIQSIYLETISLEIKKKVGSDLDILKSYINLMYYYYFWHIDYSIDNSVEELINSCQHSKVKALYYNHLGLLFLNSNNYQESVKCLEKSLEIIKSNKWEEYYLYPLVINSLGAAYGKMYKQDNTNTNIKQSLQYLYKSYKIKKRSYKYNKTSLAISAHNLATILSENNRIFYALYFEKKALCIRKNMENENTYLASSYYRYGYILLQF